MTKISLIEHFKYNPLIFAGNEQFTTYIMVLNFLVLFTTLFLPTQDTSYTGHPLFFEKYKQLLVNIREEYITPKEAETEFKAILLELRKMYPHSVEASPYSLLVFPLIGSNYTAVGGKKGNGFRGNGFNLFDQTVSGSHPAQDIFIYDKNQDCLDDRKNHYIDIASVSNGVVIATETNWQPASEYRGGNYVWIYDTDRGGLWYYAHCRQVDVHPGQMLKAGDKIGEVGRTGHNAFKPRSDTHLHLMYLQPDYEMYPYPFNHYEWLKEAITLQKASISQNQYHPPFQPGKIKPLGYENLKMAKHKAILKETGIKPPVYLQRIGKKK